MTATTQWRIRAGGVFRPLGLSVLLIASCSKTGTSSAPRAGAPTYQDWSQATQEHRLSDIKRTLEASGITNFDQATLRYIDFFLRNARSFGLLTREFAQPEFAQFLAKAVPTLFYANSAVRLKTAPAQWQPHALNFLVSNFSYDLSVGKDEFRESLRDRLTGVEDPGVHVASNLFFPCDEQDAEKIEKSCSDESWSSHVDFLATALWSGKRFTFGMFKLLPSDQQVKVLRWTLGPRLASGGPKALDLVKKIGARWETDGARLLVKDPQLAKLPDTVTVADFETALLKAVLAKPRSRG